MQPYPGLMVLYRQREPRAGQLDLAAMVTRAWPDGRVDLNVYPPMAEFYQLPKVPMLSDVFTGNVWLMAEAQEGRSESAVIERCGNAIFGDFVEGSPGLKEQVAQLIARIEALEAKRGPGRPRKDEAA